MDDDINREQEKPDLKFDFDPKEQMSPPRAPEPRMPVTKSASLNDHPELQSQETFEKWRGNTEHYDFKWTLREYMEPLFHGPGNDVIG